MDATLVRSRVKSLLLGRSILCIAAHFLTTLARMMMSVVRSRVGLGKVDLVKHDQAMVQHQQIRKFVAGTVADNAPVIPISAVLKYNIDVVCEYINCKIPIPGERRG